MPGLVQSLCFAAVVWWAAFASATAGKLSNLGRTEDRCTTVIVSKEAGTEGPMTSHTVSLRHGLSSLIAYIIAHFALRHFAARAPQSDCVDCDFRINKVPARDWPANSTRPVYRYRNVYPSTISADRGDTWLPSNLEGTAAQLHLWGVETAKTTDIPQVTHA